MNGRHEPRLHRTVLGSSAKVLACAAVHHHLRRIQPSVLELLDQPAAHQVALAGRLDRQPAANQRPEHLEVVAHVIAVVV